MTKVLPKVIVVLQVVASDVKFNLVPMDGSGAAVVRQSHQGQWAGLPIRTCNILWCGMLTSNPSPTVHFRVELQYLCGNQCVFVFCFLQLGRNSAGREEGSCERGEWGWWGWNGLCMRQG